MSGGSGDVHGDDEVADDQDHTHHEQEAGHDVRDGQEAGDVDVAGIRSPAQSGDPATCDMGVFAIVVPLP